MYFALFKTLLVAYASKYPYLNVINQLLDFVIRRLMKDTVPDGIELVDYLKTNNQRLFDGSQRFIRNLHDTAAVGLAWICYGENWSKRGLVEHFDVKFWQSALLGLMMHQLRCQIIFQGGDTSPNGPKLQKQLIETLAILMRYRESLGGPDDLYYKVTNDTDIVALFGRIIGYETRIYDVVQSDDAQSFRLHYTQRAGYIAASFETLPNVELVTQTNVLANELLQRTREILMKWQQNNMISTSIANAMSWGSADHLDNESASKAFLATENGKLLADSILHTTSQTA